MTSSVLADAPAPGPDDRRRARRAVGVLRDLNESGLLDVSDVHVAQRLGRLAGEQAEPVLLAVALAVRAVRNGSICVDLGAVAETDPDHPWPDAGGWVAAVAASPLAAAGVVRLQGTLLYLSRYWEEETQVVDDLHARSAEEVLDVDVPALEVALQRWFPDAASAEQREAARMACLRRTAVVTGGPGTGKTTTVARLLGVLLTSRGETLRIALAAPTGKAAARMTQALREATEREDFPAATAQERAVRERIRRLEAVTLHRLLGWRPDSSTRFRHDRTNRLPYDVVVVDETSMVSLTLTARLLEAVRPQARLVLVGDADQLASVEAGAVLHDIVQGWSATGPVRTLQTTHRFGAHIRALAEAVNAGDPDAVVGILGEGRQEERVGDGTVRWQPAGEELDLLLREQAVDVRAAALAGRPADALAAYDRHRLLCAHREGPYGVSHWNRHVERLLLVAEGRDWLDEWYPGRPFIVNGNDRGLRLWNGDTGVACLVPTGLPDAPTRLVGAIGGSGTDARLLPTTRLADVSTAHAMTVHRSQGSQFDEVTVVLPDPDSRILTRELLYTAVTRARRVVRVVGSEASVRAAVTRRARRATGLAARL